MKKEQKRLIVMFMIFVVSIIMTNSKYSDNELNANLLNTKESMISQSSSLQELEDLPEELRPIALAIAEKNNIDLFMLQTTGTKICDPITIVNPVVFIELKNENGSYDSEWITPENLAKADKLYNSGENSLRNYFKKISYGRLDIVTEFFPKDENGNVTSVKSPAYKSFVMPQTNAPSYLVNGVYDYEVGYEPSIGEYLGDLRSSRSHEKFLYANALEDTVSTGNVNLSVADQIAETYEKNYDLLNSRYASMYDFIEWDTEFAWEGNHPNGSTSWSNFQKTWELLSADDFTFVIRAKEDEAINKTTGKTNDILWPHNFEWKNALPPLMGEHTVKVDIWGNEMILPGLFVNGATSVYADNGEGIFSKNPDMGVITHETIHQFGAPDLYRRSYIGQAVGVWDIMAAQQEMPQTMLHYTSDKYGIWDVPDATEVYSTQTLDSRKNLVVNATAYQETDEKIAYRIYPDDYDTRREYFVVEYKKKTEAGFDSQLPGRGLLVYRVKDDISQLVPGQPDVTCGFSCGNGFGAPDEVFVFRPDANDANLSNQPAIDPKLNAAIFPRTINGTKVNAIGKSLANPPSSTFDKDTLYFSDGTNSGIQIVDISDPEETFMEFTVLYDGESLGTGAPITDFSANAPEIAYRADALPDTTLSVTGGTAPYTFSIEEIKSVIGFEGDEKISKLFYIDDENINDGNATLKLDMKNYYIDLVYEVKVNVTDVNNNTKSLILTYDIKKPFPKTDTFIDFRKTKRYKASELSINLGIGKVRFLRCFPFSNDSCSNIHNVNETTIGVENLSNNFRYNATTGEITVRSNRVQPGIYPFVGVVTFKENGKDDVVIRNENLAIIIDPEDAPYPITIPSITSPVGDALSPTWLKGEQIVTFDIADTYKGLKSLSVTTSNGSMLVDEKVVNEFTKKYEADAAIKSDSIALKIRENGTYSIASSNWNYANKFETFEVTHLDNEKPIIKSLEISDVSLFMLFPTRNQNVKVIAQDKLSGFEKYSYKLVSNTETVDKEDDQSWTKNNASDSLFVDENFQGKLYIYAYDKVGNRSERYEETITRDTISPTKDVTLSSLQIPGVTLSPAFQSSVDTYTATVENSVDKVTITALASDPTATVSGDANKEVNLAEGENKLSILVSNQGESKTYKVNITRSAADIDKEIDTTLSSLQIPGVTLSPAFQSSVDTYTATVENSVDKVTITALASDPTATVSGDANKEVNLVEGENKLSILVSNQGESKTYEVNITRSAADIDKEIDTTLSSLQIPGVTLSPAFQSSVDTYTATVENSVDKVTITALASDPTAIVSGDANKEVNLVEGENKLSILVSNQGESKTYEVNITRSAADIDKEIDTTLASLQISGVTLTPRFESSVDTYTATVENSIDKITITALASDPTAIISGDANKEVNLIVGENRLSILVSKQGESKTYKLNITREPASSKLSSIATLRSLTSSVGKLTPVFQENTLQYSISVENSVNSIKLNALTTSSKATLSGDVNKNVDLKVGVNTLSIQVMAEDKTTKKYIVVVTRKDKDAPVDEDPPQSNTRELTNSDKTITIIGKFSNDIKLISEKLEPTSITLIEDAEEAYSLEMMYDIYLEKQSGERFEPSESVTVRLQLTDELKGKQNLVAVYIKDDGSVEQMPTNVFEDYVEFTTTHFSKYGIAEIKQEERIDDVQTGDSTNWMLLSIGIICSGYICVLTRKYKRT